jgi:hypothetical protein
MDEASGCECEGGVAAFWAGGRRTVSTLKSLEPRRA